MEFVVAHMYSAAKGRTAVHVYTAVPVAAAALLFRARDA